MIEVVLDDNGCAVSFEAPRLYGGMIVKPQANAAAQLRQSRYAPEAIGVSVADQRYPFAAARLALIMPDDLSGEVAEQGFPHRVARRIQAFQVVAGQAIDRHDLDAALSKGFDQLPEIDCCAGSVRCPLSSLSRYSASCGVNGPG